MFEKLPSIGNGKWINVGRLDYNTEGLLLFTNSGELANRLMHPRYEVEREYAVRIMGRLTDEQVQALLDRRRTRGRTGALRQGRGRRRREDGSNHWYHVVLKEGRNREVRRLFEALGLMVSRLIRTRYGMLAMPTSLKRGNLPSSKRPTSMRWLLRRGCSRRRRDLRRGTSGATRVRADRIHARVRMRPARVPSTRRVSRARMARESRTPRPRTSSRGGTRSSAAPPAAPPARRASRSSSR